MCQCVCVCVCVVVVEKGVEGGRACGHSRPPSGKGARLGGEGACPGPKQTPTGRLPNCPTAPPSNRSTDQPTDRRVQFHRSELMTEVVMDTDVASADPHESLPPALAPVYAGRLLNGRGALAPGGRRLRFAAHLVRLSIIYI